MQKLALKKHFTIQVFFARGVETFNGCPWGHPFGLAEVVGVIIKPMLLCEVEAAKINFSTHDSDEFEARAPQNQPSADSM